MILPLPLKYCGYSYEPLSQVYAVVGIDPWTSCKLGNCYTN